MENLKGILRERGGVYHHEEREDPGRALCRFFVEHSLQKASIPSSRLAFNMVYDGYMDCTAPLDKLPTMKLSRGISVLTCTEASREEPWAGSLYLLLNLLLLSHPHIQREKYILMLPSLHTQQENSISAEPQQ